MCVCDIVLLVDVWPFFRRVCVDLQVHIDICKGNAQADKKNRKSCKIKGPRETEHSKFRDSEKRLEMISKTADESSRNERGDNIEKISRVFKSS